MLSLVSICALLTPSQQIPHLWDSRTHLSPLFYLCKSVGSPEKERHRDLQLCKWCYRACWCDPVSPTQPPCWWHWSLLGQEGLNIYSKCCWGTWRYYIPLCSCFPGPILSSFPSFREKQAFTPQCFVAVMLPPWQGSPSISRFAFQTG